MFWSSMLQLSAHDRSNHHTLHTCTTIENRRLVNMPKSTAHFTTYFFQKVLGDNWISLLFILGKYEHVNYFFFSFSFLLFWRTVPGAQFTCMECFDIWLPIHVMGLWCYYDGTPHIPASPGRGIPDLTHTSPLIQLNMLLHTSICVHVAAVHILCISSNKVFLI